MKILIVKTFPLSFEDWDKIGTLDREISIYKKIFKNSGNSISFFSFGNKDEEKYIKQLNPLKIYFQKRKFKNNYFDIINSFFIPFFQKESFKNADIIQSNQFWGSWIGLIASILYKKKFILREGFQFYQFQLNLNKNKIIRLFFIKILSKFVYSLSNRIIVTSNEHKKFIVDIFRINKEKITVIPNFVDLNIFKKSKEIIKNNKLLIVGRLNKQKNIELIINAISNSKYELDIIGNGNKDIYKELIKKNNSKVNFISNVKNKDLAYYYNRCSFYIMCSHFEGNPKTLLEAMACECAIIACKNKGIVEFLNENSAFLIDNDPIAVRQILDKFFNNAKIKKEYGKNARDLIIKYNDINKISYKFVKIYKEVND